MNDKSEDVFLLDTEELDLVRSKYTGQNQLLFAIMLKFFQVEGYYPDQDNILDPLLIKSLSWQLNLVLIHGQEFNWQTRTIDRFRKDIRNFLGYKIPSNVHIEELITHLIKHAAPKCLTREQYKESAYKFFKNHKLEPFSIKKMERYIASSIHRFENQFFTSINILLSKKTNNLLDNLLIGLEIESEEPGNKHNKKGAKKSELKDKKNMYLWQLKKDIGGAKLKLVQDELDKLKVLRSIDLPKAILGLQDRKLLLKYYRRIMAMSPSNISELTSKPKYAMMAIFCHIRTEIITDNLAEVLLQLIHKMRISAEISIQKQIVQEVKCINGKFDILHSLAEISVNKPDGIIKDNIYPKVSEDTLKNLVKELSIRGRWYQHQVQIKMHALYSHANRKILLKLLESFSFSGAKEAVDLVSAITFIKNNKDLEGNTIQILLKYRLTQYHLLGKTL